MIKSFLKVFVNVGNPHIIFFDKDYLKHDLRVIGPKIENHDLFPEKLMLHLLM